MNSKCKDVPVDIQAEIVMLLGAILRLYLRSQDVDDVDELRRTLGALGLSATRLAGLLKTHKQIGGNEVGDSGGDDVANDVAATISQTISQTMQELGMHL